MQAESLTSHEHNLLHVLHLLLLSLTFVEGAKSALLLGQEKRLEARHAADERAGADHQQDRYDHAIDAIDWDE